MNERNWGGKREGSGRKATGRNTVNITLTLTKSEAESLKKRADDMKMSVSRFVVKFLRLDLNTLPDNLSGNVRLSEATV